MNYIHVLSVTNCQALFPILSAVVYALNLALQVDGEPEYRPFPILKAEKINGTDHNYLLLVTVSDSAENSKLFTWKI